MTEYRRGKIGATASKSDELAIGIGADETGHYSEPTGGKKRQKLLLGPACCGLKIRKRTAICGLDRDELRGIKINRT